MNEEIQDIAEKINQLVKMEVQDKLSTSTDWKYEYLILSDLIEELKEEGEELLEDYKESGLTVNSVEAEGFLRCAMTLYNRVKLHEKMREESEKLEDV